MKTLLIPIALGALVAAQSCRIASAPASNVATSSLVATSDATTSADTSLVVSFFSIGTGINTQAAEQLDALITRYESKHQPKWTVGRYRWGREGEIDYCFDLATTKADVAKLFIQDVKMSIATQERVNVGINAACTRRR